MLSGLFSHQKTNKKCFLIILLTLSHHNPNYVAAILLTVLYQGCSSCYS